LEQWIAWLDLCGVAVFAASGALTASRKQMDIVGFCLIATVTGIGGGTVRDLLLGQGAVYWITQPVYVLICIGVGVLMFFTAPYIESRYRVLLWADAAGLALFCVTGAEKALEVTNSLPVSVIMGVMTATFGGIIRDVLCAEVPLILRKEIYATAAIVSATTFITLSVLGVDDTWAIAIAIALGFGVRAGAILRGWSLPAFTPPEKKDRT
jgi:uncharacterized membrane protein YeiH